ncbi:geraniol 8-hydroxylase-like protein [Carex littledalei]|uniref:Geraniol 8-hydroxylase-like protein n=1 Tax=Carex littledalei TaxID=544730 RepID=A0A833VJ64_9POAL|nr:geraniol 8-hydroxylase-like protein [Carex littledalei]
MMEPTTFLYTFLLATFFLYTTLLLLRKRRTPPLPPGPTGLPLVGSLPFLDPSLHTYFANLSKKYGPIFSLRLGSKLTVVVSSPSLARSILREHDDTFANRDVPAAGITATYGGNDIVWSPNGPTWRMLRRVTVHEVLSPSSLDRVSNLRQQEIQSTIRLIRERCGTPIDIGAEMFLCVMNIVTSTIWGRTLEVDKEKELIGKDFKKVIADIIDLLGQPNVSDFFSALAQFDLQGIQSKMEVLRVRLDRIFERMIEKKCSGEGERADDLLGVMLKMEREGGGSKNPFTMTHVKALLMDMVTGGTDTTSTTVDWTMAEIMKKPNILQILQEELNQVVGKDKLVKESHLPQLPFLSCVIKETLRLHPILPLLIPHSPSSPCTINGYLIPEGTRVFVNVWAIQRDPSQWPDPLEFKPERFLQDEFKRDFSGKEFNYLPFGSGRRICAGVAMAERMVGHLLATMVHSFDWKLPEGKEVDLSDKFGIVTKMAVPLVAIPTPRLSNDELYY